MADYYPLIAKAVSRLKRNTGEARRAIYERARTALVTHLRNTDPALSESEITGERLALEEAVRKVDAEAVRRMRSQPLHTADADKRTASGMSGRTPNNDPLAELARLIGQDDPFRDARPDGRAAQPSAPVWLGRDKEQSEHERELEATKPKGLFLRAALAEMVSPAPSLSSDGRLDAGPNKTYDAPDSTLDLPSLPIRQRRVIKTIIKSLPGNAPRQLKASLTNYDDELRARGLQPILGLLKDMASIIEADVGAVGADREWLDAGLKKAFDIFAQNHALFVSHFPLDPEREKLYGVTSFDEGKATGKALSEPFEEVAKASLAANAAGLTTADFVSIVDKLAEFAKVTSSLPPAPSPAVPPANKVAISTNDKINPHQDILPVSPTKRVVLSGLGFFERVYNLIGSTVTLAATEAGQALLVKLKDAISALSKLAGLH